MKRDEIQIGDVVKFKSGGLKMNINAFQSGFVTCVWHSNDGIFQQCTVRPEVLVKLESGEGDILESIDEIFPQYPINHD